ncbi:MAG: replication initiation factor domain-containing protein [Thermomonas sp.]|uniref:replication initiation factor domain-containing protein n=1 Tax=Thermomonas sp. TaxID=1971895 RepID=UPI001EC29758|nr:replication initiation factor domain-containing protein [Thermomonas sp.]MBV2210287.1 replication initiation factor domain-containing protein [Thermomonas sp.]
MAAVAPFHRFERANAAATSAVGPVSNTGQKSPTSLSCPIIDFCTVVLDTDAAKAFMRKLPPAEVLRSIFGVGGSIAVGSVQDRPFNFYPKSAVMVDSTGSVAGRIGLGDDGRMCISLTGQGCQHVTNWPTVAANLERIGGRITRLDIAVDDLTGETFDIQTFLNFYDEGKFTMNGRPPTPVFVDDMGSGKGCSFYVGQKGHKQLNVYEKGKQLGDPDSRHTRCELRLYAKRLDLPLDALRDPGKYFSGAYPVLAAYVIGEAERLLVKDQIINASAKAMVRFLRNQAGTALHLVMNALGDEALEYLMENVVRPGRPGRFKKIPGDLHALVKAQLSESLEQEIYL